MFLAVLTSKTLDMLATQVIKTKRSGQNLSKKEIEFIIEGYTKGEIPDYQMSALLMAIFLNGMEDEETIELTQAMINSGTQLKFEDRIAVDKHSTGGVGDKTSLILAPIVAACGVPVPMMSGRGLGHTGGTLDKLESIPGFNVNLDLDTFKKQVNKLNLSFIGQTDNICPADKKIYSLRDVTATVESLPLICASIMSKKIAEGIRGLVLDVKMGSGAFMKNLDDARALARGLTTIGEGHGLKTMAMITDMNQPLGRFVGNAVEIGECLSILKRQSFLGRDYKSFSDTEELSIELAARMIAIGLDIDFESGKRKAVEALDSGKAFECFESVCQEQGGSLESIEYPESSTTLVSEKEGYFSQVDGEQVGIAGICMGAGRRVITDKINPLSGIEIHKKIGDEVKSGEAIFTLYHSPNEPGLEEAQNILKNSYQISGHKNPVGPLVIEIP